MKVAAGEDFSGFGKHQRIVRRASGFGLDNLARMSERAANCPVHLGHATQGVSVLNPRIILKMRLSNLTVLQQLTQMRCDFNLSGMRARGVNAFVESDGGSLHCF